MAIKQSELRNKADGYTQHKHRLNESLKLSEANLTAFLCHSHQDEELVKGLIVVFQEQGLTLYVDWLDHEMRETPNQKTARKIQAKIQSSDVFLFLATANSRASRWCPWEIGFADARQKGIFIIPTEDNYITYGNEYLQLYPKVDKGSADGRSGYGVFQPGSNSGSWLSETSLR